MRMFASVVAVLAALGVMACAARSGGARAGEPQPQAEASAEDLGSGDCTNTLAIDVDLDGGKKQFDPGPSSKKICKHGGLTLTNNTGQQLCVNFRAPDGNTYKPTLDADGGSWSRTSLPPGKYTLGACFQTSCDTGCAGLTADEGSRTELGDKETIKGNVTVSSSGGTTDE